MSKEVQTISRRYVAGLCGAVLALTFSLPVASKADPLVDLDAVVNATADTTNAVTNLSDSISSGLNAQLDLGGNVSLGNSNADLSLGTTGAVDSATTASVGTQVFDSNGNINPNVTLGTAGLAALGEILGVDFCVELGLLTFAPEICDQVSPPDDDDPGDGGPGGGGPDLSDEDLEDIVLPNLMISDDVLGVIAVNALPGALVQRELAGYAMAVGTADLNARIQRLRGGLKPQEPMVAVPQTVPIEVMKGAKSPVVEQEVYMTPEPYDWEFFVQGEFGHREQDDYVLGEDFDANVYSGIVGLERRLNDKMAIGLAVTGLGLDSEIDGGLGSTDIEGILASAYVTYSNGTLYSDLLYSYGWLEHDLTRTTLAGRNARSDFDSGNHLIEYNIGLTLEVGPAITGPYASVRYINSDIDGYTERNGGLLNAVVDGQTAESLISEIGWQISFPIEAGNTIFVPHIRGAWVHEYLDDDDPVGASLKAFPSNRFRATPPNQEEDFGLVGAGIAMALGERTTISLDAEATFADDYFGILGGLILSHKF